MTRDEQKASQLYHLLNEVGTALVDADSTIFKQHKVKYEQPKRSNE